MFFYNSCKIYITFTFIYKHFTIIYMVKKIDDEILKKIHELKAQGKSIREIAKELGISHMSVYNALKNEKVDTAETPNAEITKEDIAIATVNPENKPILEKVIKNLAWWQEATQRIGFETVLTVFAYRKINDPEAELQKFKTADDFVKWVREYLGALFQGQELADKLLECEKRYKATYTAQTILEMDRDKLQEALKNMQAVLNFTLQFVPKEALQKLLIAQTLINIPLQQNHGDQK